jgi:PST family polysaccharide transporter
MTVGRPTGSLGTRTLRGMFWAYGSYVGGRALVLASVAILARLLSPTDFGLVAFALTVTALLDAIADLGVSQALVVSRDEDIRRRANTAWTVSVLLGVVLAVLTAALSPLAGLALGRSEVTPLVAVLALNFPLRALGVTHFALAQRDIDFRTRTAAEMSDVVVRGGAGVALALAGAGPWSLVIGYLAGTAAMSAVLWLLVPFRPRLRIERAALPGLLRFGGAITVLDVLSALIANIDYVLIGRVLGAADLGLYTLGFRLPELLIMNLSVVAGLVLFPSFAGLDRRAMGDAFLTSLRYTLMVAVPLAVALAMLAEPLVLTLFGDRWRSSVDVMQVLVLFALAVAVGIPAGTAYKATRRVDVLLKLGVPRAVLAVGLIVVFVSQGIVVVAACQAAVAGLFSVIGLALASRLLGTGARAIGAVSWPALIAGAAMAVPGVAVLALVDGSLATLLVAGPAMGAVYAATLWLVAPAAIVRLVRTAFPGRAVAATQVPDPTRPQVVQDSLGTEGL